MRLEYFEMIDAVEAIDLAGGTIRATSQLPAESPVFDGHFPGYPTLPGVLMLEVMGHAAGYILYQRHQRERFVFLGSVKSAKFRRFVEPGATLVAEARITHDSAAFSVAETRLEVDGAVVADAEVIMVITDFPSAAVKDAFLDRSLRIRDASGAAL
jgi:3-hydroxyacyl-[acyl-carrier-protein] dehydratase